MLTQCQRVKKSAIILEKQLFLPNNLGPFWNLSFYSKKDYSQAENSEHSCQYPNDWNLSRFTPRPDHAMLKEIVTPQTTPKVFDQLFCQMMLQLKDFIWALTSWHIVLIDWFSVTIYDEFSNLTREKYVNQSSFIGNSAVLISSPFWHEENNYCKLLLLKVLLQAIKSQDVLSFTCNVSEF